ncbi:MAG: hypothetical protein LPK19_07350 [Hymenobacteraceae bacterium]|nr:hypothetical protein [Hymenobacteraceae bacterium]MDX5396025.1 hypothetical protein [Hymenobacteraceae bacterium]MDX5512087.1 hypothetical protein [Hymenobacteraceae bacterium]
MKIYKEGIGRWLKVICVATLFTGCTSLENNENATEPNPPLEDPERREFLYPDDDILPTRQELSEKSSDINRKKNIEEYRSNDPANTPTELRPRRADNAPIDTTRHNIPL